MYGRLEVSKRLTASGVKVNLPNTKGARALDVARQMGHESVVKLLLKHDQPGLGDDKDVF